MAPGPDTRRGSPTVRTRPDGDRAYLLHMRDAIFRAQEDASVGKEPFLASSLIQDAIIRNLEILGDRKSTRLNSSHLA